MWNKFVLTISTRRIYYLLKVGGVEGEYIRLTKEDVTAGKAFYDVICKSGCLYSRNV
jgi:hypothetical protein